jgi:hypothetical protein
MPTLRHAAPTVTTILTTAINGTTNTTFYTTGATLINNATDRVLQAQLELILSAATGNLASAGLLRTDFWLIPALDGTNPATPPGTSAVQPPADYWVGRVLAVNGVTFTRGFTMPFDLLPGAYAIVGQNNLGATNGSYPATGNAVKLYTYNYESV